MQALIRLAAALALTSAVVARSALRVHGLSSAALLGELPAGGVDTDVSVLVAGDGSENHPRVIRRVQAGLEDLQDVCLLDRCELHSVVSWDAASVWYRIHKPFVVSDGNKPRVRRARQRLRHRLADDNLLAPG